MGRYSLQGTAVQEERRGRTLQSLQSSNTSQMPHAMQSGKISFTRKQLISTSGLGVDTDFDFPPFLPAPTPNLPCSSYSHNHHSCSTKHTRQSSLHPTTPTPTPTPTTGRNAAKPTLFFHRLLYEYTVCIFLLSCFLFSLQNCNSLPLNFSYCKTCRFLFLFRVFFFGAYHPLLFFLLFNILAFHSPNSWSNYLFECLHVFI